VLPGLDKINAPVFDEEGERRLQWEQLRRRATMALPNALKPVGRSAETLVIRGNNVEIGRTDAGGLQRLTRDIAYIQAQIAEALDNIKQSGRWQ
jgi:hypothetical protein